MENIDIDNFLATLNSQLFFKVVAENELNFKLKEESVIISNTQPLGLPGKHWVAFYYNEDQEMEFFDSFALNPQEYSKNFESFLQINKLGRFYIRNKKILQNENSNICGLYCMLFYYSKIKQHSYKKFLSQFTENTLLNDSICLQICENIFHYKFHLQNK